MNNTMKEKTPTSELWQQFVAAKASGAEPVLPDFSYAGYARSEEPIPDITGPIFDVTDFGAVPNDDQSDEQAIRDAIAAATLAGGGVVFFPPGEYLVWTDAQHREPIRAHGSRIVLRGSGSGEGGTILQQVHHGMRRHSDPDQGYGFGGGSECLFHLGSAELGQKELARVTGPVEREAFSVEVDNATPIRPGDWVVLTCISPEAGRDLLLPLEADPRWELVRQGKPGIREVHQVREVIGNRVVFEEPLHVSLKAEYGITLKSHPVVDHVGVEDICFLGNWLGFVRHHRSELDDSAWSTLVIRNAVHSWVRRCSFINTNIGLSMVACAASSVLHLRFSGSGGHLAIQVSTGYGILLGLSYDTTRNWHGPGLGYSAAGTVYWHHQMHYNQRFDSHTGMPYATLLDCLQGGTIKASGGPPVQGAPHHLRHLVVWNMERHFKAWYEEYDFWGSSPHFVLPILVGLHGDPVTVNDDHVQVNESQGQPVEPESLYEAQLALRLGKLPEWVDAAKHAWEDLRRAPLVPHLDLEQAMPSGMHAYVETFDVEPFLKETTFIPLGVHQKVRVSADTAADAGTMHADMNKVRQCVYNLMAVAGDLSEESIMVEAERETRDGRDWLVFRVKTSDRIKPYMDPDTADFKITRRLSTLCGGSAEITFEKGGALVLILTLPAAWDGMIRC